MLIHEFCRWRTQWKCRSVYSRFKKEKLGFLKRDLPVVSVLEIWIFAPTFDQELIPFMNFAGDEHDGSADLLEIAKSKMQSKNPQIQPSFRQILRSSFFAQSVFVHIENFLSDLPMKSAAEREKFFASIWILSRNLGIKSMK